MHEFKKKNKIRKILYSPFVLVFLSILLLILLDSVWSVYNKAQLSAKNLEREKLEAEKLESRQKQLNLSIEYLKTESGIENEIRTKFRAVKEGESIAVIVDDSAPAAVITATTTGFWYKIFHWFK